MQKSINTTGADKDSFVYIGDWIEPEDKKLTDFDIAVVYAKKKSGKMEYYGVYKEIASVGYGTPKNESPSFVIRVGNLKKKFKIQLTEEGCYIITRNHFFDSSNILGNMTEEELNNMTEEEWNKLFYNMNTNPFIWPKYRYWSEDLSVGDVYPRPIVTSNNSAITVDKINEWEFANAIKKGAEYIDYRYDNPNIYSMDYFLTEYIKLPEQLIEDYKN